MHKNCLHWLPQYRLGNLNLSHYWANLWAPPLWISKLCELAKTTQISPLIGCFSSSINLSNDARWMTISSPRSSRNWWDGSGRLQFNFLHADNFSFWSKSLHRSMQIDRILPFAASRLDVMQEPFFDQRVSGALILWFCGLVWIRLSGEAGSLSIRGMNFWV